MQRKTDIKVGLIVPTYNAGQTWGAWLQTVNKYDVCLHRKLVVDSSSTDGTVMLSEASGFETVVIKKDNFNHGGTRQYAAELLSDCDIFIFITQDAILANELSLKLIIDAFENPDVGAAYGRQLPHKSAKVLGSHARLFNYPAVSEVRAMSDASSVGIKAAFISNSFAAYRKTALLNAGGFPSDVILGEDTYVAAKMLISGWKIKYCSDALVYHSHDYSIWNEFQRYFDIGVLHSNQDWMIEQFGKPEGEGIRFVISEINYVLVREPWLLLSVMTRTLVKYIAYRLGMFEASLPTGVKKRLSMHKSYWENNS